MKRIVSCLVFFSLFLSSLHALSVENAYIKQTPPHSKNTAIFLTLINTSDEDIALIKAESSLSAVTELHEHIKENGVATMQQIQKIEIKAHSKTELKPSGLHIMLLGLKESVQQDSKADLILYFDNEKTLEIKEIPSKMIPPTHNHH